MKILIDNGHGIDTKGKQSPNGTIREYAYTRAIALMLVSELKARGLEDAELLTPEVYDVSLYERTRRVNDWCKQLGKPNVLLVSLHLNAAGMGTKWESGKGWQVCIGRNATQKTKALAKLFAASAEAHGFKVRKPYAWQAHWVQQLYLMEKTLCPAVLTENLFMDNREDYEQLLTPDCQNKLIALHADAIQTFVKSQNTKPDATQQSLF